MSYALRRGRAALPDRRRSAGETGMHALPEKAKAILRKRAFAHIATLMPDGSPQVSPVWVDVDGDRILVNSAEGRRKDRNLCNDSRVALSATDPDNPYDAVMIRGRVVQTTREGAREHVDKMAKKYLGQDKYPYARPGEVRVIFAIEPESVTTTG
jgi:PPOX class probable F420-dependent enzyme